jgi:hypothetical protein
MVARFTEYKNILPFHTFMSIHCPFHYACPLFKIISYDHQLGAGIATVYGMDDRGVGVRVPLRSRIFFSPRRPYGTWGPPSFLSNGYRGFFLPEVKRPGREADHSPPNSAEVKKIWVYTATPPYAFMAHCLIS